jgi:two-component system alkaline phosphatase synthesis response regulator PhoP
MGFFSSKKKILVVDDEKDIAEGIKARLLLEKFDVVLASNGQEAVEKAKSEKPHLIIMDVMMPLVDGLEACKVIRKESGIKDTPILVLTALPNIQDAEDAFKAGANDFLNKPFSNDRLIAKIQKLLPK